jgi:thioester reductase-like protein
LYTVIDRLEDRQLITKRRSKTDARRWVYCLPLHTTHDENTTKEDGLTTKDTPPPTSFSSGVKLTAETTTGNELEFSQQLFNTYSTTIQHPEMVDQT